MMATLAAVVASSDPVCFESTSDAEKQKGISFIQSGSFFIGFKENQYELKQAQDILDTCESRGTVMFETTQYHKNFQT